ncbi:MAG: zinc ribbon domain-containing protein [Planctomycetota bacterium]
MIEVQPIPENCPACGTPLQNNAAFCHRCGTATGVPREVLYEREKEPTGYEWRTRTQIFGVPLIHVCSNVKDEEGKTKIAKGIIASGDIAVGVFASGGLALGVLTAGGMSAGLLGAFGVIAVGGGFAFGGIAVAGGVAFGGIAIGSSPNGGLELTWVSILHRLFG